MAVSNERQFWTQKPASQAKYVTLEIFNANAGLKRIIANQQQDKQLTLESDAPRNAGELVTFQAVSLNAEEPKQGDGGALLNSVFGAIGIEGKKFVRDAFSSWPPTIDVIWRMYISGITEPVKKYRLQAKSVSIESFSVSIESEQVNRSTQSIARIYRTAEFPGLRLSR